MPGIVVDSGPLIALFDRSDQHHPRAREFLRGVRGTLHTNLAVITEVVHMLDFSPQAQMDFLAWAGRALRIDPLTQGDFPRILEIIAKYQDLPADFADASLVALCERLRIFDVASVDSDFTIYRGSARQHFTNLFFG